MIKFMGLGASTSVGLAELLIKALLTRYFKKIQFDDNTDLGFI